MFPFHWYLGIQTKQIMLRGGDFVSFFGPRGQRFALKSCAWGRDFDRKNSGLGGGGVATGQIDA